MKLTSNKIGIGTYDLKETDFLFNSRIVKKKI